jgi:hypothetical protein
VPLSDQSIAEHVGVHRDTVAVWRKKLSSSLADSASDGETTRKGKDGRTIKISNIAAANTTRPSAQGTNGQRKKLKVASVVRKLLTDNHPLTFDQVFDWTVMQGVLNRAQWDGFGSDRRPGSSTSLFHRR